MNKVSLRELNKQLKACGIGFDYDSIDTTPCLGVYHCNEWNHGYDNWDGMEIYPDGTYGNGVVYKGSRREFYSNLRDMRFFLMDYFNICSIKEIIIAPCYRYNQFDKRYHDTKKMPGMDIFKEIRKFLQNHRVRKGDRTGIKVSVCENASVIEMILEGAFRGVSELCLFSFEHQVLVEPNHHFDLVFWTQKIGQEKEVIDSLLRRHSNLRYFDRHSKF